MTEPTRHTRRTVNIDERRIDDNTVVLDGEGAAYFALNETGTVLWELLATGATSDELATALVAAFDVAPERARDDVATFLTLLRDHSLLEDGT